MGITVLMKRKTRKKWTLPEQKSYSHAAMVT